MTKINLDAVLRTLKNLPESVDGTYEEAMSRIEEQTEDDRELAKEVLAWISHANRPLRVSELQHALAAEEDTSEIKLSRITDEEILISVCAGLVVVDNESNFVRLIRA